MDLFHFILFYSCNWPTYWSLGFAYTHDNNGGSSQGCPPPSPPQHPFIKFQGLVILSLVAWFCVKLTNVVHIIGTLYYAHK